LIVQKHSESNKLKIINLFKEKVQLIEESLHEQSVNNIINIITNLLNNIIEPSNEYVINKYQLK
jgi:hypothetical protein